MKMIPDLIDWTRSSWRASSSTTPIPANSIDERESFTFRKGAPEAKWELALRDRSKNTYEWTGEVLHGRTAQERDRRPPVRSPTRTLIVEVPA